MEQGGFLKPTSRCTCGKPKPYRRAYRCKDCWPKVDIMEKMQLAANRQSLRLALATNPKRRGKGKVMGARG